MLQAVRRLALFAMLGLMPAVAEAQFSQGATGHGGGHRGGRGGGGAMSPDGPVFNPTQTPEWRQAGGNMERYQAIMQQKSMQQQQKLLDQQQKELSRRQQAFDKWVK